MLKRLGLLVLLVCAPLAMAQDLPEDPNENAEEITAEPPAPVVDQSQTALEDYEASEQISEDLSVSFPVDI